MNILVVNDDGIQAEGLLMLAKAMKKYGNVYVVAPDSSKSATSHSISLNDGISLDKVSLLDGITAYKINSTPADCTRIGVGALGVRIHLVVSGINNGLNVGTDILYSGTVAAAVEANILGIPSIAFSTNYNSFEIVENELDGVLQKLMYSNILSKDYTLNVNFPTAGYEISNGIRITEQGKRSHDAKFKKEGNLYYNVSNIVKYDERKTSDIFAVTNGYISITPITRNRTDYMIASKLSSINTK